jgi:hypothetical protein
MGIWFWEGHRKRLDCSGFYFHVEEERLLLAAGVHCLTPEMLTFYRDAVIDKRLSRQLKKAVAEVSVKGYSIGGKHYKSIVTKQSERPRQRRIYPLDFCPIKGTT